MSQSAQQTSNQQQVTRGYERMSASSVIVCGLARNCNATLPGLIIQLESLAACFRQCNFIVVENDSHDDTGGSLQHWARRNPEVSLLQYCLLPGAFDDAQPGSGANHWFGYQRIARIAFARNRYLDELQRFPEADFVIVVDLDLFRLDIDGIAHSFGVEKHWSCMASNGQRYSPRHPFKSKIYWDAFAFEPLTGYSNGIQTISQMKYAQKSLPRQLAQESLLEARSAFGGLAIYLRPSLLGMQYEAARNGDSKIKMNCEHRTLHRQMANMASFRLFINRQQKVLYEPTISVLKRTLKAILSGADSESG